MDAVLELRGAGKRYRPAGPRVLHDVSLELVAGRRVAVRGANGAGKTTLLRLAAAASQPSEGRVRVRTRVGYVPERPLDATGLRAGELLVHRVRLAGVAWRSARAAAHAAAGELGLGAEALERGLDELSKGQRQRVAIAGALAVAPGLLVLDEPWSGLDAEGEAMLDEALARRHRAGAALLVADHREGPPIAADATWLVADGAVAVAGAVPRAVRIEASAADGSPIALDVAADEVDPTLRRLLGEGAAIRRVAP